MLKKIKTYYRNGEIFLNDPIHLAVNELNSIERKKQPLRSDIINHIAKSLNRKITYLEIGVRNPNDNFNLIKADVKYSVDPGVEFLENPVDFKMTSDEFFNQLRDGVVLNIMTRFDIIFVDGLHLADQVERDIENALCFIKDDGFIILHDCNPPSEFHAREEYSYQISPAMNTWNGTTWKAFFKARLRKDIFSCCVDSDYGVGIITKSINLGAHSIVFNPYYEFKTFEADRKDSLNLMSFEEFKKCLKNK